MNRREFLRTAGGAAGAATAVAAGPAAAQEGGGNNSSGGGNNSSSGGNASSGGNESSGNESSGGNESGDGGASGGSGPIDYGGYLDDAPYWGGPGSTVDMTGQEQATIKVGGSAANGLSFEPAAVHVDPGTKIVWEWTGEGGAHNVEAEEGADFASEIKSSGTFEFTPEEDGVITYFCNPHKGQGMLGALAVGEVQRKSAAAAAQTEVDPEHMGVPFQAHYVGIATVLMMMSSLVFTFYLLKYGESAHTKGGN